MKIAQMIRESLAVQETLLAQTSEIETISERIIEAVRGGGKVLTCGNGGSAADAEHMVTEIVGRFLKKRRAYPAIALTANTSQLTAIANDYGYDGAFVRQVEAFTRPGDVIVGISTSGNSPNVIKALERAKQLGAVTVGLTGSPGGALKAQADICLCVNSSLTPRIQEAHILAIHAICAIVEEKLSSDEI